MAYCKNLSSSSPASVGLPWKNDGRLLIALCALALLWGGALPSAQAQTVTDLRPEIGVSGDTLSVYGSQLGSGTVSSVTMGGAAAPVISQSSTLLKVEVPSGIQGPVDVTVETTTAPERFSVVTGGTGTFAPGSSLAALEGGDAARGDVDGDGDIDLLVTGRDGGGSPITQLYVNDGSGSFTAVSAGLPDLENGTVDLGDVDNDGDLDVLLTGVNASSTRVTRLFTKDDGSLSYTASGISFPSVENGEAALGDVEGDGDLDIVLAGNSGGSATAALYTNDYIENGSLGFTSESVSLTGTKQSTVDLGDFNGDDDLDIVITGEDEFGGATTTLYTNDGGGTSFTSTTLPKSVENGAVAVGDVNNDQALDLVVSGNTGSIGSQATTLLLNDGTGSFPDEQSLVGVENGTVTLGDVNADGNLDLLLTGEQGGDGFPVTALYQGDGSQSPFSLSSASPTLSAADIPSISNSAAALGDFNGDGRLTPFIAGSGSSGPTGTLYRPVLAPVSSTPTPNAESVAPSSAIDVTFNAAVADLTGLADSIQVVGTQSGAFAEADGTVGGTGTETLTYDPNQNFAPGEQVFVRLRPGIQSTGGLPIFSAAGFRFRTAATAGPALFPIHRTVSSSETEAWDVTTGFLTGNGNLDLVVASTGDTEVTVYPGNGDGTFGTPNVLDTSIQARALALADVNGDGLLDIVVGSGENAGGSSGGDILRYYVNNGDGTFGGGTDITSGANADDVRDLAVTDLNGDGAQDLVAAASDNGSILLYQNDGSGTFSETILTGSADDPRAVTVTDADFNGTPDLVVGTVSDDDISWYANQGDGTFGSEKSVDGSAVNPRSLAAADFDQDGRPEVLSAERGDDGAGGDGRVTVHDPQLFNNSLGWVENTLATTDSVLTATPADVNADGFVDVVAGSVDGDSLVWYENTSTSGIPSFASGRTLDTGRHNVQDVIAGDFDGDGSLDPALASVDEKTVAFYPNISIGPTIYVDKTNSGAQYGTSWNKAFTSLQDALGVAETGDEIRIAEGTYYPDNGTGITAGKRDTSFVVTGALDPLTIKGGYPTGGGTRDVSANTVTLSGDVDASGDLSGNSYHVLRFDGTNSAITTSTRLDGVTVTDGNAEGSGDNGKGGGLFCDGYGGTCSPTLDAVTFTGNAAPGGQGGALFNDAGSGGTSSPVITDALFSDNSSGSGGAMHNSGGISGGTSSPDITNSVFRNNTAGANGGGAIKNEVGSNPTITKSIFRQNSADGDGGAIYNEGDGDTTHPVIISSVFVDNEALASGLGSGGGALFNDGSSGKSIPQIINAVFVNNDATNGNGGAIFNNVADPELINSTIAGNVASDQGGAMKNYGADSNPTITNTILWDNTADGGSGNALYSTSGDNVSLNFTIVDGADIAGGTITASDTLERDPQFAGATTFSGSDSTPGTADDSLVVLSTSPAVDAGDNTALDTTGNSTRDITTDITGGTRVVDDGGGATVNLGAYEAVGTTTSAPSGVADAATGVSSDNATLNATVNPGGGTTRVYFDLENQATTDSSVYAADTLTTNLSSDQPVSFPTPDTLQTGGDYTYEISAANSVDSVALGTASFSTGAPVITDTHPESGASGTTVRIRGARFSSTASNNTVTFGGTTANIDSATSTVIYAEVPSGPAGPVEISVSNGDTTVTASNRFTVLTDGSGAFSEVSAGLEDLESNRGWDAADFDSDGDLDLVANGEDASGNVKTKIYRNDGDGTFTAIGAGLPGILAGTVSWGDYNQDGRPDLVISGGDESGGTPVTKIYRNDGNGQFTAINAGLTDVNGVATWGDFDGDGDLDLFTMGSDSSSPSIGDNAIAILYRNEGGGTFSPVGAGINGRIFGPSADWADYDNDGDLDLAINGGNGGGTDEARLYRNDGNGTFTKLDPGLTGTSSGRIAWGDYNADGRPDLVIIGDTNTPGTGDGEFAALYRNEGGGTFTPVNAGLNGVFRGSQNAIAWGDYNADGRLDLALSGDSTDNSSDAGLGTTIYRNEGGGSFTPVTPRLQAVGGGATWADLNGNGSLELLVTGRNASGAPQTVLYESGLPPRGTASTASNVSPTGATLNATVNPGGDTARVYVDLENTNTGAASVYAADTLRSTLTADQSISFATPDTLNPGTNYTYDVSVAGSLDSVSVGTDSFTTPDRLTVESTQPSVNTVGADTSLATIDVTFNRPVDGATVATDSITVQGTRRGAVPEADSTIGGTGTETLTYDVGRPLSPGEQVSVTIASGIADAAGVSLDKAYTFQFTAQAGDGPAQFPIDSTITTTGDVPTSMKPADLDGDGDLDLAVAVNGSNTVAWYENDGTAPFPKQTITTDLSGVSSIYATDIDGDGDPDLVASAEGNATGTDGQTISWFENQIGESGGFASRKIITNNVSEPAEVYAADVNGDGDPDVLSASWSDNRVAWYENQVGDPGADSDGFGAQQTIFQQSASYPQSVSAADLDGDGDLDVLTGSEDDDRLAWHENQIGEPEADGDGFGPRQVISTAYDWPEPVQAADLNGDGRLDVLVASHQNNTVAWHENQGDGRFSAQKTIDNVPGATEVATGDLDGDDDLDIVLGASNGEVKWYENDGSGGFSPRTITGAFGKTGVVATADLDGDGTLDALSADKSGQQILWHPNTTIAPQVVTEPASDTTATSVTAEAKINPGGLDTEVTVQYSQNGTFGADSSATADASPLTGDDTTSVSIPVSGLAPNTTYDYRVRAANSEGTTVGTSRSITTKIAPPQVTAAATVKSDTSAVLKGTVNPGGDTTRVYMALKRTGVPFTPMPLDTLRTALLSDTTFVVPVDTLQPSTEYRTQFAAANARDSISSGEQTFVTAPATQPDTTEIAQRGGPRRLDVLTNDGTGFSNTFDLDPSTVTVETEPDHGTATVDESDGSIRYEHDGSDTTADTLEYTVANAAGQRSDTTTVAIDIFDVQVQFGEPVRGDTVRVDLTVRNGFAPTGDTTFAVRKGGTNTYEELGLTVEEGLSDGTSGTIRLSAVIPDTSVTTRGVDYYALFVNNTGTLTIPAGGNTKRARRRPAHLPVSFEELSPTETVTEDFFQAETYRMASVPAVPKGGLKAAFERSDAYGPYDANEWRLERWNADKSSYDSYPAIDSLRPGDGFWLTTRRGTPFTLPEGRTVEADTTAEIPLAEGWNQIGTPFGFAVPWDTVRTASGFSTGDIDGPVGYRNGGFVPGRDSLAPWRGYFLYNATGSPDTLKVPPVGRTGSSASQALTATSPSAKRPEAQLAAYEDGSSEKTNAGSGRYTLQVRALSTGGTAEATLGLWPEAKVGRGPYDHAQPPSVTGGLRLSALETVNGTAVPHSHSIKPKAGGGSGESARGGRSWTLRLQALEGSGPTEAKLRLQGTGSLPSGHARYVLDLTNERRLTPGAELSLEGGETRRLKVLLGTKAYAKDNSEGISLKSLETTLRANYPNPFDDKTTIEYVVAEEQTDGPITIEIYNVLGQRVETLVDSRKSTGVHRETWDGTNRYGNRVGSGVFFLRLRAGDVTETQKAVLVR